MIVICEECGKKYRIDPDKMKGETARFKCRNCNHIVSVSKPGVNISEPVKEITEEKPAPSPAKEKEDIKTVRLKAPAMTGMAKMGLGVRGKMTLLFFLIPILLMSAAAFFYLTQMETLSRQIKDDSARTIEQMAERAIADKASAVAEQVRLYLLSHPDLAKETFNRDPEFKKIAVQKVGLAGYTALYEIPDRDGIWRTWAHTDSKIIGIDMMTLKKSLGKYFDGFWKIYGGVKGGKKSSGYYAWKDPDGSIRDKFMVCVPVPDTPYAVANTAYVDEFRAPVKSLETRVTATTTTTRNMNVGILAGTIILIGIFVFIYGQKLSGNIKYLTDIADRISVGELEAEIEIKSKDEIGALAEAISRMQDSVRLSVERLRRRR